MMSMQYDKPLRLASALSEADFAEIETLPWFSNCASIASPAWEFSFDLVTSHKEAIAHYESIDWENFQLDRRGDVTVFLAKNHRDAYQEWNTVTKAIKTKLDSSVFPEMERAAKAQGFSDDVIHSVQWDVISFFQEESYKGFGIPRFYEILIKVYRDGRLPCGWRGDYPDGSLLCF